MKKNILNHCLVIWALFSLSFCFSLKAKESLNHDKKVFYAISSLRFFLEKNFLTNDDKQESYTQAIDFDEADIANLWLLASCYPSNKIQKAQRDYYTALSHIDDQTHFNKLWQKSQASLEAIWEELNPYIFPHISTVQRKVIHLLDYPNFDDNPYITNHMRKQIRRYLLPLDHALKAPLDVLFTPLRLLQNEHFLLHAGFIVWPAQPTSQIRIAQHANLPGYLLKFYLDLDTPEQKGKLGYGWERLLKRCQGAKNIRHLIHAKQLVHFSVPDKWLYPPATAQITETPFGSIIQPVILIATDMNIVNLIESVEAWKTKASPAVLDELYCILSHGFASGFLPFNIPYTKDGKFACIDTEYPKRKVDYKMVIEYLSPDMQMYWQELVRKGGPSR